MAPVLCEHKTHLGAHVMLLEQFRRRLDVLREKCSAAVAMELEFLDAFSQRAEITEQAVLLLAGEVQRLEGAGHHQSVNDRANQDQHTRAGQYPPREPSQVSRAAQKHG